VDEAGNIQREFTFPDGNASYRAVKVPTADLSIDLLRATAGAGP
jgi:hypothetical protein